MIIKVKFVKSKPEQRNVHSFDPKDIDPQWRPFTDPGEIGIDGDGHYKRHSDDDHGWGYSDYGNPHDC